jgi:hypothetical protein
MKTVRIALVASVIAVGLGGCVGKGKAPPPMPLPPPVITKG